MSRYTYLRETTPEEQQIADALIEKSITSLPYTLAAPVKQMFDHIAANEFSKAMNYALDFVEMSAQYISSLLLVRLIEIERELPLEQRRTVKIINKIDTKRPLSLGDWINDILTPLLLIAKERMSGDELVTTLTTNLLRKQSCVLSNDKREPSVVQIRNEYKGHSTTLSENIYRGVIYTLEPRIQTILRAIEPMCSYQYNSVPTAGKRLNNKGAAITAEENSVAGEEVAHYYIEHNGKVTDLYPLMFVSEKGYVYVFQTLKEESISYISSNEEAITLNDDSRNDAFDALLQQVSPHFDISKDLNWEQMTSLAKSESERFLARIYREKKYNRELFVNRKQISSALEEFYNSEATLFPILGEAGQGKTNQLCYWTEQLIEDGKCVLIFASTDFTAGTLDSRLKNIFGYSPRKEIARLIDSLHEKAVQNNEYVYVFFDAINECLHYKDEEQQMGVVALYNAITRIFASEKYSRIKVVATCRSYTWKHALSRIAQQYQQFTFTPESSRQSAIKGFTTEELEKAYEIYRELYQMETDFQQLTPTAKIRLKDPLILKVACTNYLCKTLPEQSKDFTSVALFNKMFNDIATSYAGKKQCRIIELMAQHLLSEYERGVAADSISETALKQALQNPDAPLHQLATLIYKRDGITVAYAELINKPERPVLRIAESADGTERQIQFIYERFLEYAMARVFVARECNNGEMTAPIPPEAYMRHLSQGAGSVVYMGAMRNALAIDILRTNDFGTIVSMMRDYTDNYEATLLVGELNSTLIAENYEEHLFALIDILLSTDIENGKALTDEFNQITKLIDSNKATEQIIERHKELHAALLPVIRLRQNATIATLNGMFTTDYFNEGLYTADPYNILWRLMEEPIVEVKNDAVMYIYYLSLRQYTMDDSPLKQNIAEQIIERMYGKILSKSLIGNFALRRNRNSAVSLLETAVRLTVLLIIDTLLSKKEDGHERVATLLGHIRAVFSHLTYKFALIRVMMPFVQFIMRKQLTFQSAYVNNIVEYQGFWDDSVVAKSADAGKWSRGAMRNLLPFLLCHTSDSTRRQQMAGEFAAMRPAIIDGYTTGDSMSYFVLERIMVIMGVADWQNIRDIAATVFEECRQSEWRDYTQMSLLYSLYQTAVYSPFNRELLDMYAREAEDWTLRTTGFFKARNSHKANTLGLYKRNVINWYAVMYCTHSGDGKPLEGDERCVPMFYDMIDRAIANNDKQLLFHLIENISELVSDFGYIHTALDLLLHIMKAYDTTGKVERLDKVVVDRDGIYTQTLVSLIGNALSTAKNYFADEVNTFIKRDIVGLSFPGVAKYREQILSYNPSGESLSDLFTHKFGNFLMWSLLHEPAVENFSINAMERTEGAKDCFEWFDKVIRLLFKDMFNAKV